ncbi:YdcH family protein [Azonexus sp.]|uniref:YdcH family protein n=1 Tax=Azonexus sp. TaxID=1872668 RepID=UPI0039E35256
MILRPLTEAEIIDIRHKLNQLETEHRALDREVGHLDQLINADPMLIRRLKKQKLALKERISVLRHMLNLDTSD